MWQRVRNIRDKKRWRWRRRKRGRKVTRRESRRGVCGGWKQESEAEREREREIAQVYLTRTVSTYPADVTYVLVQDFNIQEMHCVMHSVLCVVSSSRCPPLSEVLLLGGGGCENSTSVRSLFWRRTMRVGPNSVFPPSFLSICCPLFW